MVASRQWEALLSELRYSLLEKEASFCFRDCMSLYILGFDPYL